MAITSKKETKMNFKHTAGATPIDPDEADGLIPYHITMQEQLNEWEAKNIQDAENWIADTSIPNDFLSIAFIKKLHKKMFNSTWVWAGNFRKTIKSIGVEPFKITTDLTNLLKDIQYQIEHQTYSIDEIAYRFHHRLVLIHPFSNGNGRHARLMTDIFLMKYEQDRFTWGSRELGSNSSTRNEYLRALRDADKGNYLLLEKFVRA